MPFNYKKLGFEIRVDDVAGNQGTCGGPRYEGGGRGILEAGRQPGQPGKACQILTATSSTRVLNPQILNQSEACDVASNIRKAHRPPRRRHAF
jgi:hypothetical protein